MLTTGPNLGLLDSGDYGEGVYHETLRAYRAFDLLIQPHVKSASTVDPPVTPAEGDAYIVPAGATGAWAGKTDQIARWTARLGYNMWEFFVPKTNWQFGVDDAGTDGQIYRYSISGWAGGGAGGAYTLPVATGSILGGIKVGAGLSITVGGVLSATYSVPVASASVLGGVKQGSGVAIAGDGTLTVAAYSLPTASGSVLGGVKVGTNLSINGSGVLSADAGGYTLPIASGSVLGGIKVGTNLTIDGAGVLSASAGGYTLPVATSSVLGGVKEGDNVFIAGDGTLSVGDPYVLPAASAGVLGGVKVGSGLAIDGSNVLSATYSYTLQAASGSVLGGVKVGSGLAIDGSNVLSVSYSYTLPVATASVLGGVKDGTNVTIDGAGVLSLDTTLGLGVTLSAWDAAYSGTVQNSAGAFWRLNTNDIGIVLNAYNDGGWKYHHAAAAAIYDISTGDHLWFSAASGSANAAITWIQRMALDINGHLAIGPSPSAWSLSGYKAIELSYQGNAWFSGYNDNMFTTNAYYSSGGWKYVASDSATLLGQSSGVFLWRVAPGGTAGAALSWTTNMTLDQSGNLSVLGNLAINTNKFTVAAASGNTVVAGTLGVTGTTTLGTAHTTGNLVVDGDLTVSGDTVTVDTATISVEDPLIKLAKSNVTNVVDVGLYALYQPSATPLYTGLFRDATDGKYKLFDGLQAEPTTTVNIAGTGYAAAALEVGALTASSVNGNTFTVGTGVLTIAAGKTLTANNTITLAGTDGSTLAIGTGGTLGTAAYTAASAYLPIGGGTLTGNLLFTDATYDIGATGATRPRDLFLSRNAILGGTLTPSQTNGIVGTTTNNDANAGSVGEVIEGTVSYAARQSLTTGVAKTLVSISLTAGDWDLNGGINYIANASTNVTSLEFGSSLVDNTFPAGDQDYFMYNYPSGGSVGVGSGQSIPHKRVKISTTTVYYLIAYASFTVNVLQAYGFIHARRRR